MYSLLPFSARLPENPFKLLFIEFSRLHHRCHCHCRRRRCHRRACSQRRFTLQPTPAQPRASTTAPVNQLLPPLKRPRRLINNMSRIVSGVYTTIKRLITHALSAVYTCPPLYHNKYYTLIYYNIIVNAHTHTCIYTHICICIIIKCLCF